MRHGLAGLSLAGLAAAPTVQQGLKIAARETLQPSCERSEHAIGIFRAVALAATPSGQPGRTPTVTFEDIGAPERGYPIEVKATTRFALPAAGGPASEQTLITYKVVTELSRERLDPALFELPPGFRHASGPLAAFAERCGLA